MRFTRRFQAIVAIAVILALVLSGITFFLRPTTPSAYSLVDQTTLSVLKGKVEYLPAGESNWRAARGGETLKAGDRLRTGPDSHGLITFFEGTTTEIEPETEIEITRLDKPEGGGADLGIKQSLGTTWTRVVKIVDIQSKMEIETPTAVAMVRGTEFEITVTPERKTKVITSVGRVDLASEGVTIPVEAGYLSVVEPGMPPTPPVPAPPPRRALTITLHRAGRLFVTDSRGRSLGFFPETGTYINQIPGAWYSGSRAEPQVIALPNPTERYKIVISTGGSRPVETTTAAGRALVAGWYSGTEASEALAAPRWVSPMLAQQTGESYTGEFRVELGTFLAEQLVSSLSAESVLNPNEVISFGANVEGDELRGDIVLIRQALKQLAYEIQQQTIARRELVAPDPIIAANNLQQLVANVANAVMARPPTQYQTVVNQASPPDQEAQRKRLESVLREVVAAAGQQAQSDPEKLISNPNLQAIATMAALLAPTPPPAGSPVASALPAGTVVGTPATVNPLATLMTAVATMSTVMATPMGTAGTVVATPVPTTGTLAATAVPTAGTVAATAVPTAGTAAATAVPTEATAATAVPTAGTVAATAVPTAATVAATAVPTAGTVEATAVPTAGTVEATTVPTTAPPPTEVPTSPPADTAVPPQPTSPPADTAVPSDPTSPPSSGGGGDEPPPTNTPQPPTATGTATTTPTSTPVPLLSASPTAVVAGESVTVSWSNLPNPAATDWIGLYHAGSPDGAFVAWVYLSGSRTPSVATASGSIGFTIPPSVEGGSYEFRLFSSSSFLPLAVSNQVMVSGPVASPVPLVASPTTVVPGATVTVSWSGIPNPTELDWIALSRVGELDWQWVDWVFVSGSRTPSEPIASGSVSFTVPPSTGEGLYQFRLFANDAYTRLGVSNTVTVVAPTATATATTTATATGTATPTVTSTATETPTSTGTSTSTATATGTATATETPTSTATPTPTATATTTVTSTATTTSTSTATPTPTSTPTQVAYQLSGSLVPMAGSAVAPTPTPTSGPAPVFQVRARSVTGGEPDRTVPATLGGAPYQFTLPPGLWEILVDPVPNYVFSAPRQVEVIASNLSGMDFAVEYAPYQLTGTLEGLGTGGSSTGRPRAAISGGNLPLSGVRVWAQGPHGLWYGTTTGIDGNFVLYVTSDQWTVRTGIVPGYAPIPDQEIQVAGNQALGPMVMEPGYAVTGRVVDGGGATVSGATVWARAESDTRRTAVETDQSGQYALYLSSGRWEVGAERAGYLPSQRLWVDVAGAIPLGDLALTRAPHAVRGMLGWLGSGAALPKGTVSASDSSGRKVSTGVDSFGQFTLWLDPGNWSLTGAADGFVLVGRNLGLVSGDLSGQDLWLPEGTQVQGQVWGTLTVASLSVSGAVLTARDASGQQAQSRSDSTGSYRFFLPPGSWTMDADAEGYLSPHGLSFNVPSGTGGPLIGPEIYLRIGIVPLDGSVVDSYGAPVAGATVSVDGSGYHGRATTWSDGTYEVMVDPGDWHVRAYKQGYVASVAPDPLTVDTAGGYQSFTLRPAPHVLVGRVTSAGLGVPGAHVWAETAPGSVGPSTATGSSFRTDVGTDWAGWYRIELSGGDWVMGADAPGHLPAPTTTPFTVSGSGSGPNLELTRLPYTISGQVRYDGVGVAGLKVWAQSLDGSSLLLGATTDADGRYSISALSAQWMVWVEAWDFMWPDPRNVAVSNASVPNVDFDLQTGEEITGTVISDATSLPLADAEVVAEMYDEIGILVASARARTDANGVYRLRLPAGYWQVRASKYHYLTSYPQWVSTPDWGGSVDFYLTYGDWGISGRVMDAATGQGQGGVHVSAQYPMLSAVALREPTLRGQRIGARSQSFGPSADAWTASDGSYTVWVPDGCWEVGADLAGHVATKRQTLELFPDPYPPTDTVLVDNMNFYVEPAPRFISGTVIDPMYGGSDIQIQGFKDAVVQSKPVQFETSTWTDYDGRYTVPVSPGRWNLSATDWYGEGYVPAPLVADVGSVDLTGQDFWRPNPTETATATATATVGPPPPLIQSAQTRLADYFPQYVSGERGVRVQSRSVDTGSYVDLTNNGPYSFNSPDAPPYYVPYLFLESPEVFVTHPGDYGDSVLRVPLNGSFGQVRVTFGVGSFSYGGGTRRYYIYKGQGNHNTPVWDAVVSGTTIQTYDLAIPYSDGEELFFAVSAYDGQANDTCFWQEIRFQGLLSAPTMTSTATPSATPASVAAGLGWVPVQNLPAARSGLGAAAVSFNRVFAIGGSTGVGADSTAVEEYNLTTGSWMSRAPLPSGRYAAGVVSGTNGKIYVLGGFNSTFGNLSEVLEYDPSANSWTTRASMPTARSYLGAAADIYGKIYAIGGTNGSQILDTVEEYDPSTNSWTTRAPMPTARRSLGVARGNNGWIYAIGGWNSSPTQPLDTVEQYNPSTNTWTTRMPMMTARHGAGAVHGADGLIYVLGGNTSTQSTATVEKYNAIANSWATDDAMLSPRESMGAAATMDGRIFAIGGMANGTRLGAAEQGIIPGTAAGPTSVPTATGTPDPAVSLSVSPTVVAQGETVYVTWSGITSPSPSDWFAPFLPAAPNNSPAGPSAMTDGLASASKPYFVSLPPGIYQFRLIGSGGVLMAASGQVTVLGPTATATPTGTATATATSMGTPTATATGTATTTPTAERPTMYLHPPAPAVGTGQVFGVEIRVDLRGHAMDTVDAFINYDPAVLELVTSSGEPASSISMNSSVFTGGFNTNTADTATGRIDFSATKSSTAPDITGSFTAATAWFRAVVGTASTSIAFMQETGRWSDLILDGDGLDPLLAGSVVTVSGPTGTPTATPTPTLAPTYRFRDYWGSVVVSGGDAPAGTLIRAFSPRWTLVGEVTTATLGWYGYMRVYGEDTLGGRTVPGMRDGEAITFEVNGVAAASWPSPALWQNDPNPARVDLGVPMVGPTSTGTPSTLVPWESPTPTGTPTLFTPTATPTPTGTSTATSTPTATPTLMAVSTETSTPTMTTTSTPTATATYLPEVPPTETPTELPTPTETPTVPLPPTETPTVPLPPTETPTELPMPTETPTMPAGNPPEPPPPGP